ncbi:hypothetical protein DFA_00129 [Cavenderia fasciculata]|uniref:CDP-diacylglycerol--inositol 3-phosphatidyltransferase n=1 Tax=Cavenderia fasciculata TaxID=261658 RepID=F4PXP1_CACFS|nr:uncharacterized protein DFA_00129 [Cavenderia fasciculata]EGG19551.1 hypothetical protein DFA_00129 [Cavenderia fasciculata]|eukprot:XP_004357845.1 hypothetical protein DFA_00129 [Cavenderia fasciculata]
MLIDMINEKQFRQQHMASPVYFYIPNLIGYCRVIFAVLAFFYSYDDYQRFFVFYALSALLDMADGHAARYFNQCKHISNDIISYDRLIVIASSSSQFGAVLDMVTDRCSTVALIVVLSQFYPQYLNMFIFLIVLDILSHFARLVASAGKSHKTVAQNHLSIMRIYYGNKYFLAFMCFGNEGFFLFSYLYYFFSHSIVFAIQWYVFFPICFVKQAINVIQFFQAATDIVELDDQALLESKKSAKKTK